MTLGKYIVDGRINASIINISDIPLQKTAYKNVEDKLIISKLDWKEIEKIRENKSLNDSIYSKFIIRSFKLRFDNLIRELGKDNYKIISCGHFSNNIVKDLIGPECSGKIELIYHPSYGWWAKEKSRKVANKEMADNTFRVLDEIREGVSHL
jgi:hypothetical protein